MPVQHSKLFKVCHLQDAFQEDPLPSFALGAPNHATVAACHPMTNHRSQTNNKLTCGEQFDLPQGEPICIFLAAMSLFIRSFITTVSSQNRCRKIRAKIMQSSMESWSRPVRPMYSLPVILILF
jgi:hypothetical protein